MDEHSSRGFKIAIIGAGSVGFTRTLVRDILSVPDFAEIEIALTDINAHNLEMIKAILDRMIAASGLPTRISATTERARAIEGARYVICCIRQGGLDAFREDITIPLKYGVDQCVGDTICAGGIMYGQRTIPALLDICRDIRELAEPGARLLNYANPMAMNTWAANAYGGVETIGLCHGIQHGWRQIAEVLGAEDPKDVDYICTGINHQTWYIDLRLKGRRVGSAELLAAFERHPVYSQQEKLRIDVLRRFGYYSTESNGHLSEYLPWYRKRPEETRKWIDMSQWIHGETGGYLRVCTEGRNWFEEEYPRYLSEADIPIDAAQRTDEHASHIIEALETGRVYRGHFNVVNKGRVTNLPADAIVETPGFVDRFGLNMAAGLKLPEACAVPCIASINVQRLAVQAAMTGDIDTLKLAMLNDPLVGAVCTPEEVWQMTDELVVAEAPWLPQYAAAVPAARQRLADARVPTREWEGAARLSVRSVEQMRIDRAKKAETMNPDRQIVA
jgi:alpha-galactosidase